MIEPAEEDDSLLPLVEPERRVFESLYLLKSISWSNTGLSKMRDDIPPNADCPALYTLIDGLLHGEFTAANYVLYRVWQRGSYLRAQQEFSDLYRLKCAELPPAQAKEQATTAYIETVAEKFNGVSDEPSDWSHARVSRAAHQILRTGSRWALLMKAFRSVEVILLIQENFYSPESNKTIGYVIDHGTKDEFQHLMTTLLDPRMNLREDLFRLNGLVRLIEKLGFSESGSELRPFLSEEVQERLQIWPETAEELLCPKVLRQDEQFDLSFEKDVDAVFGIRFKFRPADSDAGRRIFAEAAAAGVYAPTINDDDVLMQAPDDDATFASGVAAFSPLAPAALWNGEGLLI